MTVTPFNQGIVCELDISAAPHDIPVWSDMGVVFEDPLLALYEALDTWPGADSFIVSFTGDRKSGDPVDNYLFSDEVQFAWSAARRSRLRIRCGKEAIVWNITLAGISEGSGDRTDAVTLTIRAAAGPPYEH